MNDDLIEWLRAEQEAGWSTDLSNLFMKSADEIERLRAELAEVKESNERLEVVCTNLADANANLCDKLTALKVELAEAKGTTTAVSATAQALLGELKAAQSEPVARTISAVGEWVSQGDGTWIGRIESHLPFAELTNLYTKQPADAETLRDAERYRKARTLLASKQAADIFANASPDAIDAAIDAAMKGGA